MRVRTTKWLSCCIATAIPLLLLLPGSAAAETHTFLNTNDLYPTGGAGTEGPANHYPSSIIVSGLSGAVSKATVTVLGYHSSSPTDTDMAIVGPNGQQVMLMSDACGSGSVQNDNWTFDDDAPTYISGAGCGNYEETSYKPSNYFGNAPEPDDLSTSGGPLGPYLNALSFLAGGSPNGAWNLFVLDDNSAGFLGFDVGAWALTLNVNVQAPPAAAAPNTKAARKCKKLRTKRKRRRCLKRAGVLAAQLPSATTAR